MDELLKSLMKQKGTRVITVQDARSSIYNITQSVSSVEREALFGLGQEGSSSNGEKRREYLLRKAACNELTDMEEAEELVRLLERERDQCEKKGELLMPAIIEARILFVRGLQIHLLEESE